MRKFTKYPSNYIKAGDMFPLDSFGYYDTDNIKTLYHWVRDDRVRDYVLENGITADDDYSVYLSAKPLYTDRGHLFEVTIPDNYRLRDWRYSWWNDDKVEFDFDHQYNPENPYFIYEGDIPKEYVKLLW